VPGPQIVLAIVIPTIAIVIAIGYIRYTGAPDPFDQVIIDESGLIKLGSFSDAGLAGEREE
jgi:hypothetical protein